MKAEEWEKFVEENWEKIYELARRNTQYNKDGHAVISRDDSWFYEDEWDEDLKKLTDTELRSSNEAVYRKYAPQMAAQIISDNF